MFYQRMKVSSEARRLAKYKEKKNLASERYSSTLRFVRQYHARRHYYREAFTNLSAFDNCLHLQTLAVHNREINEN